MGRGRQPATLETPGPRPRPLYSSPAHYHLDGSEDSYLVDPEHGLACVFDGVGGGGGGDLCSQAAAAAVQARVAHLPANDDILARRDWLRETMAIAADAVRRIRENGSQGTTAVMALRAEDYILVASAGDSRAYCVRASGEAELLTRDDDAWSKTDPAAEEARWQIDRAETREQLRGLAAGMFDSRNRISRDLGMVKRAEEVIVEGVPVEAGDLIVVCSDGIHDNLAQGEIERMIAAARPHGPAAVAEALGKAARERADDPEHFRAKDDDITCVCLVV